MSHQDWFGAVSVALAATGYTSYIVGILKKRTKPHLFSWGVWAIIMTIVFVAQFIKGAGAGAWVTGFSAAACLTIAALAIQHGEKNITTSDWLAFFGAITIIPVWYLTRDPLWAVLLATVIDAMAYYPTFRKSYGKPYEENTLTYSIDVIKWVVAFFALGNYSATTLIYPMFCLSANTLLVVMILWRRSKMLTPVS